LIDVTPLKIIDDKTALGLWVELPESPAPLDDNWASRVRLLWFLEHRSR